MNDHRKLIERLETLVDRDNQPDWKDVVRRAGASEQAAAPARRTKRSYFARRLVPAFALAAAIIAVGLIAPWQRGPGPTVVDRALAALGDQPVVHVVFRDFIVDSGSYVDIATGHETPIVRTTEIWADKKQGLEHLEWTNEADGIYSRVSIGGMLITPDKIYTSEEPQGTQEPAIRPTLYNWMTGFSDNYRSALEDGTAHVAGNGTVDGHAVTWVEWTNVHLDECPLGGVEGPNILSGCSERVAIDNASSLPLQVVFRNDKSGNAKTEDVLQIASIETLPAGGGNFSRPEKMVTPVSPAEALSVTLLWRSHPAQPSNPAGPTIQVAPTDRSGAAEALPGALWAGERLASLPLAGIARASASSPDRAGGSKPIRQTVVKLHYGDGQTAALWSETPQDGEAEAVVIYEQKASPDLSFWPDPSHPAPAGSMVIRSGWGWLEKDGLYILFQAPISQTSSHDLILAAARALKPIQP